MMKIDTQRNQPVATMETLIRLRMLVHVLSCVPVTSLDEMIPDVVEIASGEIEMVEIVHLILIVQLHCSDVFDVEAEGIQSSSAQPPLNQLFPDQKDLLFAINVDNQVIRAMFVLKLRHYLLFTLHRRRTLSLKMRIRHQLRRIQPQKR